MQVSSLKFDSLPPEALFSILEEAKVNELVNCQATCWYLYNVFANNSNLNEYKQLFLVTKKFPNITHCSFTDLKLHLSATNLLSQKSLQVMIEEITKKIVDRTLEKSDEHDKLFTDSNIFNFLNKYNIGKFLAQKYADEYFKTKDSEILAICQCYGDPIDPMHNQIYKQYLHLVPFAEELYDALFKAFVQLCVQSCKEQIENPVFLNDLEKQLNEINFFTEQEVRNMYRTLSPARTGIALWNRFAENISLLADKITAFNLVSHLPRLENALKNVNAAHKGILKNPCISLEDRILKEYRPAIANIIEKFKEEKARKL